MPTLLEFGLGVLSLVLGAAWIVWPLRMSRLQAKVLYLGHEPDPDRENPTLGRVSGAVLALLGLALVTGVLPP